jgi:hypothetical protein
MAGRKRRQVLTESPKRAIQPTWSGSRTVAPLNACRNRTGCCREEFRAPAGVRKSPRKEPADHSRRLWRFQSAAHVRGRRIATGSGMRDAGRSLRCAPARLSELGTMLAATLSAAMITTDACGSVARGMPPAAEVLTMPCRIMKPSPGSSPSHPAVRAAASSVRTSR